MNSSKEDSHDFHCQAALARLELIHSVTNHGTTAQQMAARDEQLRRSKSQAKKERQAREVLQVGPRAARPSAHQMAAQPLPPPAWPPR